MLLPGTIFHKHKRKTAHEAVSHCSFPMGRSGRRIPSFVRNWMRAGLCALALGWMAVVPRALGYSFIAEVAYNAKKLDVLEIRLRAGRCV